MNLITTKFIAPRPPITLVERFGLLQYLTLSTNTKLVLVSAPAGAGKSTLLSHWLQHSKHPAVWLSLEPGENDLRQFMLYLVGALQQLQSQLGHDLLEHLQLQDKVEPEPIMVQFVNGLSQLAEPTVLVLDDYHVINNPSVHAATRFLLEHLPLQLCLAIGSRSDPPFALGRLRVRGQIIEVRSETLRFGVQETEALLNEKFALGLSQASVTSLEDRTEGWVAGLQLAALSLAGRPDKEAFVAAFAGSHRHVADYLVDEVLDRQSTQLQRFLQRTSVLDRFTVALCEAVVAQPVEVDLLRRLEAANLFLIPLDDERKWYRYHHLFAEFLRHRLHEREPETVSELHRRASVWFEQHGWSDEAIHQALLAGDFKRVGRLVEEITFNLGVYWNSARVIKLLARLPLELIATFPRLSLYYVWPLLNTGQVAALVAFLPILERSISSSQQPRVMRALKFALMGYRRMWLMDFAGAVVLGHKALAVLEEVGSEPASDEERFMRTGTTNLIAYGYLHSNVAKADRFYPIALERSRRFGNIGSVSFTLARYGRVKHRLGQLRSAWELFQTGFEAVLSQQREGERREVNMAELCVSAARLLYEWNRLDEAQSLLERAKPYSERSQYTPVQALGHQTAFELCLARGEPRAARALLSRLDRLAREVDPDNTFFRQRFDAPAMHLRLRLAGATLGLAHLQDEVAAWVEANGLKPDDAFSYPFEASYGVLARLRLAQGQADEALALLERLNQASQADGRGDDLIRYRLLQVLAHQTLSQEPRALEVLQTILELAAPQDYCRSFVDEGPAMQALLLKVAEMRPTHYLTRLLAAFPRFTQGTLPASSEHGDEGTPTLSSRQLDILRLLAAGNSNKQIARRLELSPNTVKWYVQNLYADLSVNTRLQAVNRARKLGLDL